ncbi:chromosome partition protein Smc [Thalassobaculum fulvum]|uniref:Chromosome partition protein Smc n=1 Tax=Thalassobaculum fulvum TaxID=1633335 RepID=A0A918XTX8_9PROT|nr:chromosome segregation protein SMC [Thalassobaculum fulvum]GHD55759.1 chromosome partition protein Smc [Thalassobaculum fulvum]
MHFSKLRLAGFKSFVDPTEVVIEPGLTGVVGPNGCGKSNLVEALRWVMGETSAKQMRGDGMDDVIFGGTTSRPKRNMAEVSLVVANEDRRAPAQFNDAEELEIIRRIERERGSHYRVNGREVRARDVQLLFADAATGARSAGLVSQGKIGSIVQAKPTDRRALLEEAANIRGLHTRRHEAELRLRAAEQNLERLDDVLKALEGQRQALRRQAKQAQRYRALSEQIRRAESIVLHRRWTATMAEREVAGRALAQAGDKVALAAEAAAKASTAQAEAAAALPELRQIEAAASAELQRLTLARGELDAEERRITTARSEAETRLRQIADDAGREKALLEEAAATLARLTAERDALTAAGEGEAEAQEASQAALTRINRAAEEAEEAVHKATEAIAVADARRAALERQIRQAADRIARLERQQAEMAERRAELARQAVPEAEREAAARAVETAAAAVAEAEAAAPAAREAREAAKAADQQAREALRAIDSAVAGLEAEADGLRRLLVQKQDKSAPIVDQVTVEAGWEAALGAALGDDLESPELADAAADTATGWRALPEFAGSGSAETAAWPAGIEPLAPKVKAPAALARRLSRTGVAADPAAARAAQAALPAGARVVTRAGGVWRWDGYSITPGAPSAAAIRLERRNRLAELDAELAAKATDRAAARSAVSEAEARLAAADEAVETARTRLSDASSAQSAARSRAAELEARVSAVETKLSALDDGAARLAEERAEAASQQQAAEAGLAELPDVDALRSQSQGHRATLAERRAALVEARTEHDRLVREGTARRSRLSQVVQEITSWTDRRTRAETRVGELDTRRDAEQTEIARLEARPEQLRSQREQLSARIEESETGRRRAADRLVAAESKQSELDRAARDAERAAGEAREARIRAESVLEQINQTLRVERERIAERLDCTPDKILEAAGIDPNEPLPEADQTQSKLDRLIGERESIGPVNLRAETELEELDQQIQGMENERDDLTGAIQRLRSAIASLNREGRERLLEAFHRVDRHFQTLFTRLFGGGEAHLKLTETEDPLDAGLEIMASPPGKKMQHLSLFSGGEQALTAVALVFAVFLTNPSPICVLDEVDAPLDDTNVDRFCSLLQDIVKETGTRFLIITHHRMTMARMDRLFGVTMAERGVSQLVSVDLARAERLRDAG